MLEDFLKVQSKAMSHVDDLTTIWNNLSYDFKRRLGGRHGFSEYTMAKDIARYFPEAASILLGSMLDQVPSDRVVENEFEAEVRRLNAVASS